MTPLKIEMLFEWLGRSVPERERGQTVTDFQVDSRLVGPGSVYFALVGERADGHDYLEQVARQGALLAVVHTSHQRSIEGLLLIQVSDVLSTLQDLARACIAQYSAPVLAVTGSLGKTTCKEFLRCLLTPHMRVTCSPGNANSQIGLPLSVLNQAGPTDLWLLEMGISEPGNMRRLTAVAPPTVALVTQVSRVHAQDLGDVEDIAWHKTRIWEREETRHAIAWAGVPRLQSLRPAHCPLTTFSLDQKADYQARVEGKALQITALGDSSPWMNLPRTHPAFVHNVVAAAVTARCVEVSWESIARILPTLSWPGGRSERFEMHGIVWINDAYNASRVSMLAALDGLPSGRRRIAVLGDMRELGRYEEEEHAAVLSYAVDVVDRVFLLGDRWARKSGHLPPHSTLVQDKGALIELLSNELQEGDIVLLKGSRVWDLGQVMEAVVNEQEKRSWCL